MSFAETKSVSWKVLEEILAITISGAFTGTPGSTTALFGDGAWKDTQPLDTDLTALAALGFVSAGLLKKTAANTYEIDTTAYTTAAAALTAAQSYVQGYAFGNTYTPTITNGANVASSTARVTNYFMVGTMGCVFGSVLIDPTSATTDTTFAISLPVASNLANAFELVGFCGRFISTAGFEGSVLTGDTTNNRATVTYYPASALAQEVYFLFAYQVIA